MAKPMKQLPARLAGMKSRMVSMSSSSMHTSTMPMLMPAVRGMLSRKSGRRLSEAKAMRALA